MCDGCEVNQKYYRYSIQEPTKEDILLESLCIPTQTQVRQQLGSKLADVFFENLSSEGRIILGLQPPLTGPDDVWINPNSRLKNRVRCKPVPDPVVLHQKAFTHHAILELGEQYIQSMNLKVKKEIEESLREQAGNLEERCNKRLIEALEKAKMEADEQCKQVVGTMMEHFDRCFSEMVEKNKLRMRKECQMRVREERAELASYMLTELQREVEKRDIELCSDFSETLHGELNALATRYMKQIDAERKVAREVIEEIIRKYETMLVNVRSEMEICSLVDVCRAINEEKMACERENKGKEAEIKRQISLLMEWVMDLKEKNNTLQEMARERAERIRNYEKKMKVVIEEFQKFVNYALKATPAHAEFLLSAKKMILKNHLEDMILRPEDYEAFKKCLSKKTIENQASLELLKPRKEDLRVCIREGDEESGEGQLDKAKDSKYTFNYYRFKYSLMKNLIKELKFPSGEVKPVVQEKSDEKKAEEQRVPEEKGNEEAEEEYPDEELTETLEEYRKSLVLSGENAKEHMLPIRSFLQGRMDALSQLCKDDPPMTRMVLGCGPSASASGTKKP